MRFLRRIKCWIVGHWFVPSYETRWVNRRFRRSWQRTHAKSQFTCERCGCKTKWMNQKETDVFLDTKCTWSDPI